MTAVSGTDALELFTSHEEQQQPLLEVKDMQVSYGGIVGVHGATMRVRQGAVVAVLGPNGAGKSSLLRGIAGVVRCQRGSVRLDGTDITKFRLYERARLGITYLQEGRSIFPRMTVRENFRVVVGTDEDTVEPMLEKFPRLRERLGQVAGTLSGGEQQMLAVSIALLREPRILLLDEPSLGLAPVIVHELFETFRQLREEGTTMVLVEQFAHMVLPICDEVHVLQKGRQVFSGRPQDIGKGGVDDVVGMYLRGENDVTGKASTRARPRKQSKPSTATAGYAVQDNPRVVRKRATK